MVKFIAILLFIICAGFAQAQTVLHLTNNVIGYTAPDQPQSMPEGTLRLNLTVTDGVDPIDMSSLWQRIYLDVIGRHDQYLYGEIDASLTPYIDAANGRVRFLIPAFQYGEYEIRAWAVPQDPSETITIGWHYLTVTQMVAGAATFILTNNFSIGDTSVTNVFGDTYVTNIIENVVIGVTNVMSVTNIIQILSGVESLNGEDGEIDLTSSDGSITITPSAGVIDLVVEPAVAAVTGGWGMVVTTNSGVVNVSLPEPLPFQDQYLRSNGLEIFWATDRAPLLAPGTNYVTWANVYGAPIEWEVPLGISNIVIHAWGGGGASESLGGAGGYAEAWHFVQPGETLMVVVATSGQAQTSIIPGSGWPGGGTNSASTYNFGGGFSGVYRNGTNEFDLNAEYLLIAGGGGASVISAAGTAGGGGGLNGQDTNEAGGGRGGTQFSGGAGWNGQTNNFGGRRFFGGGGFGSALTCGGGGYYGGGAGTNVVSLRGGGGGSAFIGTNAVYGFALRADRGAVPYADHPQYISGVATPAGTTLKHGQVTIRY